MSEKINAGSTIGHSISLAALNEDPNAIFAALREHEPVSWVPATQTWFLTRFKDISDVLRDSETFSVEDPDSLLSRIFGSQILSVDGVLHDRYRRPVRPSFTPKSVKETMQAATKKRADQLIQTFEKEGQADLRTAFANRYPVLNTLDFFGLDDSFESDMRAWYDSFEQALSNFEGNEAIEREGRRNAKAFLEMFHEQLQTSSTDGFITAMKASPEVSPEELARNALTIFFGGISTVEALVLNAVWILCTEPGIRARVEADRSLLPSLLDETMRWASPVQSSIRIAKSDTEVAGVHIREGERVACMLGAANRDPEIFDDPDTIDIDRPNLGRHIGFSMGRHFCLGKHLAKFEAECAIDLMLTRLSGLRFAERAAPAIMGYEFRQPRSMPLVWNN